MEIEVEPLINGDMSMLQQYTERDYDNNKMSSPYHTVLHGAQGFIFRVAYKPDGVSIQDLLAKFWPTCGARTAVPRGSSRRLARCHSCLL